MQNLADYAIARHFPHLEAGPDRYLQLLRAVIEGQASLLARWMNVGFVHGVMNTDNMTISGETIDYGPCAFVDTYHSSSVFSSIDRNGRYAYGNQPPIAQWNLSRFAETLLPLLPGETTEAKVAAATAELEAFGRTYRAHWLSGMRAKLGWEDDGSDGTSDDALATALLEILERNEVDFTRFFRALPGGLAQVKFLFLDESEIGAWLTKWEARCNATRAAGVSDGEASAAREAHMNRVNPVYIPRNHLVEEALAAAVDEGNFGPFQTLLTLVSTPFVEREGTEANPHAFARYALGAPKSFYPYQTFCGT
jgi:uncharacterized protein YdiU (UPF0061 family)